MVREKSGKRQGILLYSNCGHPDPVKGTSSHPGEVIMICVVLSPIGLWRL